METYINNVTDITYQSELTPHPENYSYVAFWLGEGLIRPSNLRSLSFRKLWAH